MPLLEVEDLQVEFGAVSAPIVAVDGVDLMLDVGEVVGCVGESGSGKSMPALAGVAEFSQQLAGGMAQSVMIAMAIGCNPKLLIADERTTALDVTVQAQVLELLLRLQRERGMALLLITHDLAVVAETARRVFVMYAGQVVETGEVPRIFEAPLHPYTQALLAALPEHNRDGARLKAIPGVVPGAYDRPAACLLHPRCDYAVERCRVERPALEDLDGRQARCHFPLDPYGRPTRGWLN